MGKRILLAVLALGVLLAAFYALQRKKDREARTERAEARFLALDERGVEAFELEARGASWRFEREDGVWRSVAPIRDAADSVRIGELFAALREVEVVLTIDDPDALDAYGLAPPKAEVRIESPSGKRVVDMGDRAPTGEGMFVRLEGRDGVLVIDDRTHPVLRSVTPEAFRDASLLDVPVKEAERVAIRTPRATLVLERRGDGWWYVEPRVFPASEAAVEQLLDGLFSTAVTAFLDGADPSEQALGLDSGGTTIEVESPGRDRTLVFGGLLGGLRVARRSDRQTLLGVDPAGIGSLPLSFESLSHDRLTKVNRYRVERFVWTAAGSSFEAEKRGGSWFDVGGAELPEDDVYAFLAALLEARVDGWSEGAPTGSEEARLAVEVEGGASTTVTFFRTGRAVVDSVPGVVYRVDFAPLDPPRAK